MPLLKPEEAAAVDLIREREAEIEELRAAIAVMQAGDEKLGITRPSPTWTRRAAAEAASGPHPALSLSALFKDYAKSGAATDHTVAKWRAAINAFVEHLGHEDAAAVTRSDVSGWLQSLVQSGLTVRTVAGTYRAAVARILKLAHNGGQLPGNPAERIEVIGPKATKTKRDDISDDEAEVIRPPIHHPRTRMIEQPPSPSGQQSYR